VDVGVVVERSPPGVQHAEEPGLIAQMEAGLSGERPDRTGGGGEQRLIADALIGPQEGA